jgi:hypothetical protein
MEVFFLGHLHEALIINHWVLGFPETSGLTDSSHSVLMLIQTSPSYPGYTQLALKPSSSIWDMHGYATCGDLSLGQRA